MAGKKRKRTERPTIHPRNKYSDNSPDFGQLASLYPSFEPFIFYSRDGRPSIDWTDFNATRELTRVLLLHDHGLNWWIPDGQLCPTVPNRSNYIHWIEDLLSSDIIEKNQTHIEGKIVRGFDIGTGANCIYPLLGASLLGWSFIGSDMTDVAIEWAEANVKNNPQISKLIEIRKVKKLTDGEDDTSHPQSSSFISEEGSSLVAGESYVGPNILVGVVLNDENFDFCMCNPPFFEKMSESGLNPQTSCGGTPEEMVCVGGERAFIGRIIEDSIKLKRQFRWYTSMVGKKCNLKILMKKLREIGVTVVKTTEFVQGRTSRWGLAWSFMPPAQKIISLHIAEKNVLSFTLEGIQKYSAISVLQMVESFFSSSGASCKSDLSTYTVNVTASSEQCNTVILRNGQELTTKSDCEHLPANEMSLRIVVFQQNPGTLLVRGSLQHQQNPSTGKGMFTLVFQTLEEMLRRQFCKVKHLP